MEKSNMLYNAIHSEYWFLKKLEQSLYNSRDEINYSPIEHQIVKFQLESVRRIMKGLG